MATSTLSRNSTNVRNIAAFAWHRVSVSLAALVAPRRAVERAARLFTTPPRFPHTARELELLATGSRFELSVRGSRVAAWRFGRRDRPVVLLSHGWGGRGAQWRAFVPALLEAGYQPVVFDHVAHGYSEGSESSLVHFVDAIEAVARFIEDEGAKLAALVGHSLGAAAVGVWLNRTRREVPAVLVAPPISLERYAGWFARRLGLPQKLQRAMRLHFERRLGMRWRDFELPQSVANIRAPALVIHDTLDREVSPGAGLTLARAWPGARFVATHGLGHRAVLKDPAVAGDTIDFIAGRVVFAPPPARGEMRAFAAPAPLL